MATNLPQNTTYNTTGKQSPLANFSAINKLLQQNTQKASSTMLKGSLDSHFNPDDYTKMFGSNTPTTTPTNTSETGFPINTPIGEQDTTKTQSLPEGYNQFVPADQNANWNNPSDQTVARNWPTELGGGQYLTDSTQPGAMIKSSRAIMDYKLNPGAKQKILGKLSPQLYQVDHIVPLWVGGADTLQNLEIFDNITHANKTAVQSVPLTLLANGKIDLNQAKLMALSWKDKDGKGIPTPDNSGYIPLNVAEKYAQKWDNDLKPRLKDFAGSFAENMSGLFSPKMLANLGETLGIKSKTPISELSSTGIPVLSEFGKGLVGGTGMVPNTEASPESGLLGKVSNFAGNLITTITGIGLMGKVAAGVGLFGAAEKAATVPFLRYAGTGINALDKVIGVGSVAKTATQEIVAKQMTNYLSTAIKSAGVDIGNLSNFGKWSGVGTSMYRNSVAMTLWGQLGLGVREVTGQENFEFQNHLKQAAVDTIYGSLLGSAGRFGKGGQSVGGYTWVGGATTAWSLIQGADIQTAVQDGIIMTALHGMGYKKGIIDPKSRMANDEAFKESLATAYMYDGKNYSLQTKGISVPEIYTLTPEKIADLNKQQVEFIKKYPDNPVTKNMVGEIKNTTDALYFSEQKALQDVIDATVNSKGSISQSDAEIETTRIISSFNQLRNQTLPLETRQMKEWKDTVSMGPKLRGQTDINGINKFRPAVNSNEVLNKIDYKTIDSSAKGNTQPSNFIFNEPTTIVGYGENLGKAEKITANEMAQNPENFKPYLVGVVDNNTQSFMRRLFLEQQRNPKLVGSGKPLGTQIVNPDATVRWFALQVDPITGEVVAKRPVGYSPQEESYTKNNNVNKTPDQIINRLQHILTTYKDDPVALQKAINSDKSMNVKGTSTQGGSVIDLNTATDLANRIKNGEIISEETLFSIIKPSNAQVRYSSGINNVSTFNAMKDNNSNYIIGNISKSWFGGGTDIKGTNEGRRKAENPNNPFIEITGMYIPGKEVKSPIGIKSDISNGISGLLTSGKTELTTTTNWYDNFFEKKLEVSTVTPEVTPKIEQPTTNIVNNSIKNRTNQQVVPKESVTPENVLKTLKELSKKNTQESKTPVSPKKESPIVVKQGGKTRYYDNYSDLTKIIREMDNTSDLNSEIVIKPVEKTVTANIPETKITPKETIPVENTNSKYKNYDILKKLKNIEKNYGSDNSVKAPLNPKKDVSSLKQRDSYLERQIKIEQPVPKEKTKTFLVVKNLPGKENIHVNKFTNEFLNDLVDRIENTKIKVTSAEQDEKTYMNLVDAFTRKNPGLPEDQFKELMKTVKSNAQAYVKNLIDEKYRGTEIFGEHGEFYKRTPLGPEKNVLERRYNELQNQEKPQFTETKNTLGDTIEGSGKENIFNGVPLRSYEIEEMKDLKVKIDQYKKLDDQINVIKNSVKDESILTPEDKKKISDLEYKKVDLTIPYERNEDIVLAHKYDLKLKTTPEGYTNLDLNKDWSPNFSDEYKTSHNVGDKTPFDVYGKVLQRDLEIMRNSKTKTLQKWAIQLKKQMTDTTSVPSELVPYTQNDAKAFISVMDRAFSPLGKKWTRSWGLNNAMERTLKEEFATRNQEGQPISQPFRNIIGKTKSKTPTEAKKNIEKANEITKTISDKAKLARIEHYANKNPNSISNDMLNPSEVEFMKAAGRTKDLNQSKDVMQDVTPMDLSYNGIINMEARNKLIEDYEQVRNKNIDSPEPTTYYKDGTVKKLGTEDEMKLLFQNIKTSSTNIPEEVKTWVLGEPIELQNNGAPTAEQGFNDGFNRAMKVLSRMKKGSFAYVKYNDLKKQILGNTTTPKLPDAEGGPNDGQGGIFGDLWGGIKNKFSNTITYNASDPINTPNIINGNIDYSKLRNSIKFNETNTIKNPYSFTQPSGVKKYGNANGAYQVTDAEIKERSKQFLGRDITPKEFIANPTLQDQYMDGKLKYLQSQGYNKPEDFIASHRAGFSDTSEEAKAKRLKERANYVKAAMNYYNSLSKSGELATL